MKKSNRLKLKIPKNKVNSDLHIINVLAIES